MQTLVENISQMFCMHFARYEVYSSKYLFTEKNSGDLPRTQCTIARMLIARIKETVSLSKGMDMSLILSKLVVLVHLERDLTTR